MKNNDYLVNDSKENDEQLIQQFKAIFTTDNNKTLPYSIKRKWKTRPSLDIRQKGVENNWLSNLISLKRQVQITCHIEFQMSALKTSPGTNINTPKVHKHWIIAK